MVNSSLAYETYGNVDIGENSIIGDYVVLGYPKLSRIKEALSTKARLKPSKPGASSLVGKTKVGKETVIGSHTVIHEGTVIGNNVSIDDHCRIGYDCDVGSHTRVIYAAFICDRVKVGTRCTIAGFVCDGTVIGDNSIILGRLVHELTRPHKPWGEVDEPAPEIEENTVVGYGSVIVGGVKIARNVYIAAGAIVTKDVPPCSVVVGLNEVVPADQWEGDKLDMDFFEHS